MNAAIISRKPGSCSLGPRITAWTNEHRCRAASGFAAKRCQICGIDAPAFREFWMGDAARLAAAVQKVGKVEGAK